MLCPDCGEDHDDGPLSTLTLSHKELLGLARGLSLSLMTMDIHADPPVRIAAAALWADNNAVIVYQMEKAMVRIAEVLGDDELLDIFKKKVARYRAGDDRWKL